MQLARELGVNVDSVRMLRDRKGSSLVALSEASRLLDVLCPGVMPKFTTKQRSQMAALGCSAAAYSTGKPLPALANGY